MTESSHDVFVLCCVGGNQGNRLKLPCHGAFVIPEHDIYGVRHDAVIGLPFGVGSMDFDRVAFGMNWVVVRVATEDAEPLADGNGAVVFRRGFVIFFGDRRGALEALIQYGADRRTMTVQLALPDGNGISRAGTWGVAIGGQEGYAQSGEHGIAIAGRMGVARSGARGQATVEGGGGLAVVDAGGTSTTDREGIAVARGRGGHAVAGAEGIAVGLNDVDFLRTLEHGVAVARRDAGLVLTGVSSIVVVGDTPETGRGVRIKVGAGTLVVCRLSIGGEHKTYMVVVAGRRGFKADASYDLIDGQFCERDDSPPRTFPPVDPTGNENARAPVGGGSIADGPRPNTAQPGQPWWEAAAVASPRARFVRSTPTSATTTVLRRTNDHWTGPVEVEKRGEDAPDDLPWDPDPKSHKGLFGLAWGRGDASRLEIGENWTLTMVDRPIEVPTTGGGCVKFERGEVIYCGDLPGAIAGLRALGVDPASMAFETATAGASEVAHAGWHGAATAGDRAWAIAGDHAEVGRDGYAEATAGDGWALAGPDGIAQVSTGGSAMAGDDGVAISFSRYSRVSAGGLAVARNRYVNATAFGGIAIGGIGTVRAYNANGIAGVAIGSDRAIASDGGIAIARSLCATVRGDMGALLVLRHDVDHDDWIFAIVGKNGIEPDVEYSADGGAFAPAAGLVRS